MKRSNKTFRTVCSSLAAGALAVSMVPVGAVSAFADEASATRAIAFAGGTTGSEGSTGGASAAEGATGGTAAGSGSSTGEAGSGSTAGGAGTGAEAGSGTGAGTGTTGGATGGSTSGAGTGTTDPTPEPTPTPAPVLVKPYLTVNYAYSHSSNSSQKWSDEDCKQLAPGKRAHVTTSSATQRLECVRMSVEALEGTAGDTRAMGIKYKVLSGKKWSSWKSNGTSVGTDGTKIQAIRIKLTGTAGKSYSVHYRVKTRGTSWLGWASDGADAGTSGIGRDISDLQVEIKQIGKKAPGATDAAYITDESAATTYSLAKASGSVSTATKLGASAGTAKTNASNGIGIALKNTSTEISGDYSYKVYQKSKGWSKAAASGKRAGVKSKKYPVTAISINRTGKLKSYYDVYCRVYVKNYGWMGWAKNGQAAGSKVFDGFNVTAYQVKLVYKGGKAPGKTDTRYSDSNGVLKKAQEKLAISKAKARLDAKANKTSSATSYLLLCDRSICYTAVYTGSKGHWKRVKFWRCCVGASSTPTPKGSYTVQGKEPVFHGKENAYSCYYGVVFDSAREMMFHSVGYKNNGSQADKDIIFSNLGQWASHGCVRLELKNAKWLYDHVGNSYGTKVVIF